MLPCPFLVMLPLPASPLLKNHIMSILYGVLMFYEGRFGFSELADTKEEAMCAQLQK